jgi:hypothetical protein
MRAVPRTTSERGNKGGHVRAVALLCSPNARRPVGSEPLGRQNYLVTPGSLSAARQSTSQNVYKFQSHR